MSDSASGSPAEAVRRVAGNFGHALDTSFATQPMTTVGLAAVMGFVLGASGRLAAPSKGKKMFASLFKRAEASVDNAVGDLGNRIVIAVPFLIALGFGAYSLSLTWIRFYGPEVGNLLVAAAFSVVGLIAAIVVKTRSSRK